MKLREGSLGATAREEMVRSSKYRFESLVADDPSYREGVGIIRDGELVGTLGLRMDNRKLRHGVPQMDVHDILDSPVMFRLGDVFHTQTVEADRVKEEHWLCIEENNLHGINRDGVVESCNYLLRWQNASTLKIIERWSSVRSPYSSSLDVSRVITVESAKYRILVPLDSETSLFRVGTRFLIAVQGGFEPMPYSIVEFDPVSSNYQDRGEGFLSFVLKSDQIKPSDNWELMIADYVPVPPPPPPQTSACKIVFTGSPTLRMGGAAKEFRAAFFDGEGVEIDGIEPAWELALPDGLPPHSLNMEHLPSGPVVLRALAGAGQMFKLNVSGDDATHGLFSTSVEVAIASLW